MVLMIINLLPQRRDDTLELIKAGDTLVINGESFDFSALGEGDTLPRRAIQCEWLASDIDVEKLDGEISITLLLPIPAHFSPEQAFPVPLINVADGPVVLPGPLPAVTAEGLEVSDEQH